MILIAIFQLSIGFAILSIGGHYLVEGSTRIALLARISTAVVGLTIVALGTSMPELAVSMGAAARGETDLAYANVVGSNIFNVAVILSITALIRPVPVPQQTIKLEYPFMVLTCWIMLLLSRDGLVDRLEGAFFLFSLTAFLVYMVRLARLQVAPGEVAQRERQLEQTSRIEAPSARVWGTNVFLIAIGQPHRCNSTNRSHRGLVD